MSGGGLHGMNEMNVWMNRVLCAARLIVELNIYCSRRVRSTIATDRPTDASRLDATRLWASGGRPGGSAASTWESSSRLQGGLFEDVGQALPVQSTRPPSRLRFTMAPIWVPFLYIGALIMGMLTFSRYLRRQKQGESHTACP